MILVNVAYEPDCSRVNLNETTFLFIFLNKISFMGNKYLDELFIFREGWQLLVLELASLVEFLTDKKLQIVAVDGLIISFKDVTDKSGIDHLLLAGSLRPNKLGESRPDLVDISELFLHNS